MNNDNELLKKGKTLLGKNEEEKIYDWDYLYHFARREDFSDKRFGRETKEIFGKHPEFALEGEGWKKYENFLSQKKKEVEPYQMAYKQITGRTPSSPKYWEVIADLEIDLGYEMGKAPEKEIEKELLRRLGRSRSAKDAAQDIKDATTQPLTKWISDEEE